MRLSCWILMAQVTGYLFRLRRCHGTRAYEHEGWIDVKLPESESMRVLE